MAAGADAGDVVRSSARKRGLVYLLRLWFGISEPVRPKAYALSGFGLMLLKYTVEAGVIWFLTARILSPLDFVSPALQTRTAYLRGLPDGFAWAWFLWTLLFLWIAVTMSVRRAVDAGRSPWLGLAIFIPIFNFLLMLVLCISPSAPCELPAEAASPSTDMEAIRSAALAVGFSVVVGGVMLWVSVYLLGEYGTSLFIGAPLVMSATASYLHNRNHPRGAAWAVLVGIASVAFAGVAMLLFAFEGALCAMMAMPLVVPLGVMGGLIGMSMADSCRRPSREIAAVIFALPLLAVGETLWMKSAEFVVLTAVDVHAPPEVVWQNVVSFPDLTEAKPWYFSWGVACPERARIEGSGVGATRYCEFTTGTFVEPITVWDEPRRLAFDVTKQPEPMIELSPYHDVHPPHLNGYLRSTHGEFLLVPLADGGTRLEGRTWYKFEMFPQWYWTLWSDLFIHRIHERVLEHIKAISEAQSGA